MNFPGDTISLNFYLYSTSSLLMKSPNLQSLKPIIEKKTQPIIE